MDIAMLLSEISGEFEVIEHEIAQEKVYLVYPRTVQPNWYTENLQYRSSIWTKDSKPVSLGFKKFFNLGERPDLCGGIKDIPAKDTEIIEKIDGSCLIVSRFKGQLIVRTRRTIDATKHENGKEIEILKSKYQVAFYNDLLETHSLIYEWVSPNNYIVIRYPQPDIYLIGAIRHEDYKLMHQGDLDRLAVNLGVRRPRRFGIASNLQDVVLLVRDMNDIEGICIYSNKGQTIHKVKSKQYLLLHSFRSNCTIDNIADILCSLSKDGLLPPKEILENHITTIFDYECSQYAKPIIKQLYLAVDKYNADFKIASSLTNRMLESDRKEFASLMLDQMPVMAHLGFLMRDNKEIRPENIKKVLKRYYE